MLTAVCCLLFAFPMAQSEAVFRLLEISSCSEEETSQSGEDDELETGKLTVSAHVHRRVARKRQMHEVSVARHHRHHRSSVSPTTISWPTSELAYRNGVGATLRC